MTKRAYKQNYNDFKFLVFENAKDALQWYEITYNECGIGSTNTHIAKRAYIRWLSVIEKMKWSNEWHPIEAETIEGVDKTYEED